MLRRHTNSPGPRLPRTVRTLGVVSLLNDLASEMIYPLLPAFVTGVLHGSTAALGLVEGVAEATASLVKVASGWVSDRVRQRKALVVAGYGVSAALRPLTALATAVGHVLVIRLVDRIGKGLRSAPRDALVAAVTPPELRGRAFGFHRSMDHAGAFLGPLVAAALLACGLGLRPLFALAAVPGLLTVIVLIAAVREPRESSPPLPLAPTTSAPAPLSAAYRRYLAVLALFTLGNSSDAFLLLRAQQAGLSLAAIPLLWAFHHGIKSAMSTWGGALSDRIGRRRAIQAGWAVYALAYLGFALATRPLHVWLLFALYSLYFALSEGAERALVADLSEANSRGRAFGLFHGITGATLLPASLLTGVLWQMLGAPIALGTGAALAALAGLLLFYVPDSGDAAAAGGTADAGAVALR
jgi:MFS family permease